MAYLAGKKGQRPTPEWVYQTYYQDANLTLHNFQWSWDTMDKAEKAQWVALSESLPVFPDDEFKMDGGDRYEIIERTRIAVFDAILTSPEAMQRRRCVLEGMTADERNGYVSDADLDSRTKSLEFLRHSLFDRFISGRETKAVPKKSAPKFKTGIQFFEREWRKLTATETKRMQYCLLHRTQEVMASLYPKHGKMLQDRVEEMKKLDRAARTKWLALSKEERGLWDKLVDNSSATENRGEHKGEHKLAETRKRKWDPSENSKDEVQPSAPKQARKESDGAEVALTQPLDSGASTKRNKKV